MTIVPLSWVKYEKTNKKTEGDERERKKEKKEERKKKEVGKENLQSLYRLVIRFIKKDMGGLHLS